MSTKSRQPDFEPDRSTGDHLKDLANHLLGVYRAASGLVRAIRGIDPADRKNVGAGAFGAAGLVSVSAGALSGLLSAPVFAYFLLAGACQLPWMLLALPAVREDSGRRRKLYRLRRQDDEEEERQKQTRERRKEWASSLVGPLAMPLEQSTAVAGVMIGAVEKCRERYRENVALVLVRRSPDDQLEVVLTAGEIDDLLKTGTKWDGRTMDVHEYVREKRLYPHHMIERERLGGVEYFLVATAEIDLVGEICLCVLDCFLDMVVRGIGRVVAYREGDQG